MQIWLFVWQCSHAEKMQSSQSLISELVKAGGTYSFRGSWELQETNCRWIYILHVYVFFKHNQFQFFGVFWIVWGFLSVIWYPDLYFMLTCWPEPANEDIICMDSTEASVRILQSKSRGSCCHPQSLHQGICKWWRYMMCSRFRWNQWFQWHFGVHLILCGWNLGFFLCLCPCPHKLLHVSILFKLKNMGLKCF